jgi:hypothetical protein
MGQVGLVAPPRRILPGIADRLFPGSPGAVASCDGLDDAGHGIEPRWSAGWMGRGLLPR